MSVRIDPESVRSFLSTRDSTEAPFGAEDLVTEEFRREVSEFFSAHGYADSCVLGFDLFRYSDFVEEAQCLIPHLLDGMWEGAVDFCIEREPFLFHGHSKESLIADFASTGDGGFQVVPTPLHALALAFAFQLSIHAFNAGTILPRVRNLAGPFSIRYAVSCGRLFRLGARFYGPAVIRNARLLGVDSLNRFLVDGETHTWFQQRIFGLESLPVARLERLKHFREFGSIPESVPVRSVFFRREGSQTGSGVVEANVQKLGPLSGKRTPLEAFNVDFRVRLFRTFGPTTADNPEVIVAIGNANSGGFPAA